jgi:hypothetical protein
MCCRYLVLVTLVSLSSTAFAQSTSPWIRMQEGANAPPIVGPREPQLGASYLIAEFWAARIYQNSNWWTNLVEGDRQGLLDISLEGRLANVAFKDARAAPPIAIRRNNTNLDISFRKTIAERLPTTYQQLTVTVHVSKAAKDSVNELLNTVAEISNVAPNVAVSKSALGAASAGKMLLDYLFQKQLLEPKLTSTLEFPADGASLPAGYYVAFAADQANQYGHYINAARRNELIWDGLQVSIKDTPADRVTYFVMRVSYADKIFPNFSAALGMDKPWAALYKEARRKVDELGATADGQRITGEARAHLMNARRLLDVDPDLIQAERDRLHEQIRKSIEDGLNEKLDRLKQGGGAGGSGRGAVLMRAD